MPTPTEIYIATLTSLQSGDLGLLRTQACRPLDATLTGFDLFTGIWWPLRQRSPRAPRREVAWLVAKLYASVPAQHERGRSFAASLARILPHSDARQKSRSLQLFDAILTASLTQLEPHLAYAIGRLAQVGGALDWAQLTDDLSDWENRAVRQRWADQYLNVWERRT